MIRYSKSIISCKALCKYCIPMLRWDSLCFFGFGGVCLFGAVVKTWTCVGDLGWAGSASTFKLELSPDVSLPSLSFLICMWDIEVTIPITQGLHHHYMTQWRSKSCPRAGVQYLVAKGSLRAQAGLEGPPESGCFLTGHTATWARSCASLHHR